MKGTVAGVITLCVLSLGFSLDPLRQQIPKPPSTYNDPELYSAMSFVLNEDASAVPNRILVINEQTVSDKEMPRKLGSCAKVPVQFQDAARDFEWRATRKSFLKYKFQVVSPYALLGTSGFDQRDVRYPKNLREDDRKWVRDGTIFLAIGLDQPQTHAIVYLDFQCGGMCSGGNIHFLQKVNGSWNESVDISKCEWMS